MLQCNLISSYRYHGLSSWVTKFWGVNLVISCRKLSCKTITIICELRFSRYSINTHTHSLQESKQKNIKMLLNIDADSWTWESSTTATANKYDARNTVWVPSFTILWQELFPCKSHTFWSTIFTSRPNCSPTCVNIHHLLYSNTCVIIHHNPSFHIFYINYIYLNAGEDMVEIKATVEVVAQCLWVNYDNLAN